MKTRKFNRMINGIVPISLIDKHLAKKANLTNCIFLAGSMRSGTTFLQETLEKILKLRLIFEPLSYHANVFNDYHYSFIYNTSNGITEYCPFFLNTFENLNEIKLLNDTIKGKYSNNWIIRNRNYYLSSNTIVKSVRANLILDSIYKEITPNLILIIRNPIDIWKSLQRMPKTLKVITHSKYLKMYIESGVFEKYDELNYLLKIKFNQKNEAYRNFLIVWIIQNYVPLKQSQLDDKFNPLVLNYDDLIKDPFESINSILFFTKNSLLEKHTIDSYINKKSSTTLNFNDVEEDICYSDIYKLTQQFLIKLDYLKNYLKRQ